MSEAAQQQHEKPNGSAVFYTEAAELLEEEQQPIEEEAAPQTTTKTEPTFDERNTHEHVQLETILKSGHWVKEYILDLMNAYHFGTLDFNGGRIMMDQQEKAFGSDLVIARRMYRLYPNEVARPD